MNSSYTLQLAKTLASQMLVWWSIGMFAFVATASAQPYAFSERMKIEARAVRVTSSDSLFHYCFREHLSGSAGIPDHWETGVSSASADSVILRGNPYPCQWRTDSTTPLVIAVQMEVASLNRSSIQSTLRVLVTHVRAKDRSRMITTFDVPWNIFTRGNTDTVVFSPLFHLAHRFEYGRDSLLVEVHSPRVVNARIAWVMVEDTIARDMMMCYDLPRHDSLSHEWAVRHDRIVRTVLSNPVDTLMASVPLSLSQFASHAEVSAILRAARRERWNPAAQGGR